MNQIERTLGAIGLSESEIKVYIALLQLGPSQKGAIVKKSRISPSKLYEVADRLIRKGLASDYLQNGVRTFCAAPPQRITGYLEERKSEIAGLQEEFSRIRKSLDALSPQEEEAGARVYRGWKGLETVYEDIITTVGPSGEDYVYGANSGEDEPRTTRFYQRVIRKYESSGIRVRAIFNEKDRKYAQRTSTRPQRLEFRYVDMELKTEVNIYAGKTALITLEKEPIAIIITGEKTAKSFMQQFNLLWERAKP